jgi:hypothetical protein
MFGNSAFSNKKSTMNGNDYLTSKKANMIYHSKHANKRLSCYQNMDLYNRGRYLKDVAEKNVLPFNKSDLEINLHSYYDLENVKVIKPTNSLKGLYPNGVDNSGNRINFDVVVPFYYYYKIDPDRKIFNHSCGSDVDEEINMEAPLKIISVQSTPNHSHTTTPAPSPPHSPSTTSRKHL